MVTKSETSARRGLIRAAALAAILAPMALISACSSPPPPPPPQPTYVPPPAPEPAPMPVPRARG